MDEELRLALVDIKVLIDKALLVYHEEYTKRDVKIMDPESLKLLHVLACLVRAFNLAGEQASRITSMLRKTDPPVLP